MAEPTAADVERYTSGRLDKDELETLRLLSAGLTAARRFCGWHVSPILVEDDVTIDGPDSALLVLPTLRLVELTSLVEDGITLDVDADLRVSRRGLVNKRSGGRWSRHFGAITVSMEHGFDAADDFNAAVLSFVDRSSLAATGGRHKAVGPFQYEGEKFSAGSAFSDVERNLLSQYRLEMAP